MTPTKARKIAIPGKFADYLEGTGAGQGVDTGAGARLGEIYTAGVRKSAGAGYTLTLTFSPSTDADAWDYLAELADALTRGPRIDLTPAELKAAKTVLSRIAEQEAQESAPAAVEPEAAPEAPAEPVAQTPTAAPAGGHLVGYGRVSTKGQDTQLQRDALNTAGAIRIFEEKMSGKTTKGREALAAALDYARPGDTVCVWKLDRLGRSTLDILKIAEDLHARGIGLRVLTGKLAGNYSPNGEGKFFFTIMAAFAELERDMIRERTLAGLEAARAEGRVGGRPSVITDDVLAATQARKAKGQAVPAIAKELGVSKSALYRALADAA